ncbi:hypothetical protein niasHT_020535 [Heterodera trifolii]|uniref:Uncharacterized protein n=1 Tax=Heterodera trifolii TaxID=157864 RepID=A0ABD2J9N4_9BILA
MPFSSTFGPNLLIAITHFTSQLLLLEFFRFILSPFLCRVDALALKVRLEKGQLCADDVLEVLDFLFRHPFRLSLFLANVIYRVGSVFSCVQFMTSCDALLKSAEESGDELSLPQSILVLICLVLLLYLHLTTILNIFIVFDHLQYALLSFLWFLFTNDRKGRRIFAFLKLDGITLLRAIGFDELLQSDNEREKTVDETERTGQTKGMDEAERTD